MRTLLVLAFALCVVPSASAQPDDFEAGSGYVLGPVCGQPMGQPSFWECLTPGIVFEVEPHTQPGPLPGPGEWLLKAAPGGGVSRQLPPCPGGASGSGVMFEFDAIFSGNTPAAPMASVKFTDGTNTISAEFTGQGGALYTVSWKLPGVTFSAPNLSTGTWYRHSLCIDNSFSTGGGTVSMGGVVFDPFGANTPLATPPATALATGISSTSVLSAQIVQSANTPMRVDNVHKICKVIECYPDCDMTTVLDFFDFLCFQNAFVAGQAYADCDASGSLDFFDFLCFQTAFVAGCP